MIVGLLGGLALFLFGMDLMSKGLELTAGDKLQMILEKLTNNKIMGIILGTVVTALVQSSSAVTVTLVGFVNSGIMSLNQAISVIMGANIGTTVTGQIVALNITEYAPLIAFAGFVMFTFIPKVKIKYIGQTVMGLGFLFMGLNFMSESMAPLRDNQEFISILTRFENPGLGIFAGTILTGIIQSSSASVGILQSIANQGIISLSSSMYIIFGFNIGTCVTSVLSSINGTKSAKRTALSHVLFNIGGTIIFLVLNLFVDIPTIIKAISPSLPAAQIANLHTIFNIVTTILLFPVSDYIGKIAIKLIPGEDKERDELSLQYIGIISKDPSLRFSNLKAEIIRMLKVSMENYILANKIFFSYSQKDYDKIMHNEELINYLNKELTKYIISMLDEALNDSAANKLSNYMNITRRIERIGDHSKALAENAKYSHEKNLFYSQSSKDEYVQVRDNAREMFEIVLSDISGEEKENQTRKIAKEIDELTDKYRILHIERMKNHLCDPESGLIFEKFLTEIQRISEYLLKITLLFNE
ncbi:MAG: Na/Pi cotransporter family protein [Peptoniphilaceae bacterium]|nr:Na/Pi cotransporter family protein [Peptoniphilaceae bacterium]MDD7383883.1 Na/Pi cotransporter family protein [Peptoniphilaceae bacterium]MDY3738024.1 Na/Pi cotransporter family protein [Peptoniphilaceae bacterium]